MADLERDDEAFRLHEAAHAKAADLPLVLVPEGELRCRRPARRGRAKSAQRAEQPLYDLCIVGGGRPRRLRTARRRTTVVIERRRWRQAGESAAIENYLGFPKGLSCLDRPDCAVAQVRRFGGDGFRPRCRRLRETGRSVLLSTI
jgi:thioredoxin reductase (NADPH)